MCFPLGNIVPSAYTHILAEHFQYSSLENSMVIAAARMRRSSGRVR